MEENVEVEELSEEEGIKLWRQITQTPRLKDTELDRKKALPWLSNKVWVLNKSGKDVIVYVQRSNAERVLKTFAAGGTAGPGGAGAHVQLENAHREHRVQKDSIGAQKHEDVAYSVGGGATGAYVTAMLHHEPTQLFCSEREVDCGYRLVIKQGPTFPDPAA
ncbi:hypothetical protein N2152v2_010026 [Parachlorella kessleri]